MVGAGPLEPRRLPGRWVSGYVTSFPKGRERPYVAGIYHYAPRRGGSVADRWNRLRLSEQDRPVGAEADGFLGAGVGGCGQYRGGGGGGPYRVQLGHRRGVGDASGGGLRDQHDLVHA